MTPVQYELEITRTALVRLDMRSGEIDSFLELSGNALSASDDDSGNNHDAKLSQILLPGRYQVSAQSVNGHAGLFELSYSQEPLQQGNLGQLKAGQFTQGRLSSGQPGSATLRIKTAGEYAIDLASSDFVSRSNRQAMGLSCTTMTAPAAPTRGSVSTSRRASIS